MKQSSNHIFKIASILLLMFLAFQTNQIQAQNKLLDIKKTYDYGSVDNWENKAAIIKFRNNSKEDVRLLPTYSENRDVYVDFPRKAVPPGGIGEVKVYCYPAEEGPFNYTLTIYTNIDEKPMKLRIKGTVRSFAANAILACPGAPKPEPSKNKPVAIAIPKFEQQIIVIDKKSKRPINNVDVIISDKYGNQEDFTIKDRGLLNLELPSGRYTVKVQKSGYRQELEIVEFNQLSKELIVQLDNGYKKESEKYNDRKEEYTQETSQTSQSNQIETNETNTENNEIKRVYTEAKRSTETTRTVIPRTQNASKDAITYEEFKNQQKNKEKDKKRDRRSSSSSTRYKKSGTNNPSRTRGSEAYIPERPKTPKPPKPKKTKENKNTYTEQYVRNDTQNDNNNREETDIETNIETNEQTNIEETNGTELSSNYKANNIVFLIDVSKSMEDAGKMTLLKESMKRLTDVLREIDKVTLIVYSSKASVLLPSISSDNKAEIYKAIESLETGGGTRGVQGIETAYKWIDNNYIKQGNNQIILATDGEFKNSTNELKDLNSLIRKQLKKGINLSVVGFGQDETAAKLMKRLAYSGKGRYINIKSSVDAEEVLVDEIKTNSYKGY